MYPIIGNTYTVGDHRNGKFEIKVIAIRRTRAQVEILKIVSSGSRRSLAGLTTGSKVIVPFSFFEIQEHSQQPIGLTPEISFNI